MAKRTEKSCANTRDSGEFKIISCDWVGGHTYRITTESKKYGRVTQEVLIFPDSALDPDLTPKPKNGYFAFEQTG
jgi:hypothetical protein